MNDTGGATHPTEPTTSSVGVEAPGTAASIKLFKDPDNPVRQLIVQWDEIHPGFKVINYEVYLQYTTTSYGKILTQKVEAPGKLVFSGLKSNTCYTASVVAVGKKRQKTFKSESTSTDMALRNDDFKINQAGKPTILECSTITHDSQLKSNFTWKLADLGSEVINYSLSLVDATYKEEGQQPRTLHVSNDKSSAEPVDLMPGKKYSFRVVCTYTDLDTEDTCKANDGREINTDIGDPVVGDITWKDNKIFLKFTLAPGGSEHTVKMLDADGAMVEEKKVSSSPTEFSVTDSCRYGKRCTFEIVAKGKNGKVTRVSEDVLIGGERAITNVNAALDENNPRRQLVVAWKEPTQKPEGYKLVLYEMHREGGKSSESMHEEVTPLEQNITCHTFVKLKSGTAYTCEVSPLYGGKPEQGTRSNSVTTEKRRETAFEKQKKFDTLITITHKLDRNDRGDFTAMLTWTHVDFGENYQVLNYHITVEKKGWFWDKTVVDIACTPEKREFEVLDIKKGNEYSFKLKTVYEDLDIRKSIHFIKEHTFFTNPSKTKVDKCCWNNGVLDFSWTAVAGAKNYTLIMKDEFLGKKLSDDYTVNASESGAKECSAKIQMTDKLAFGKVCMTRVTVLAKGDLFSVSDWTKHLIGGDKVPRNVRAIPNSENPKRSIVISFDAPNDGLPDAYAVVAIPKEGKQKSQTFPNSPAVFEYLRSGMPYTFKVAAIKGGVKSEGSLSNKVLTTGNTGRAMVNIKNSTEANFSNATISSEDTNINFHQPEAFGKVRDVKLEINDENEEKDVAKLHWIEPSFGGKQADYRVEEFKVEIRNCRGTCEQTIQVKFQKDIQKFSTEEFSLRLNEKYNISITTEFEIIDEDKMQLSAAEDLTVSTRPNKPKVIINDWKEDNKLKIVWSAVKGAEGYDLEIFTNHSKDPYITKNMETRTEWIQTFDEKFGYGTTYHAAVTAYSNGKKNSFQTLPQTIGGDYVPRDVEAWNNVEQIKEPNTQIFLKWKAPTKSPKSYKIEVVPEVTGYDAIPIGETCLVSGLKAGTEYLFKVIAVHRKDGRRFESGGCFTKKIWTDPKPTQVKNVRHQTGANPCNTRKITWDKVDAEKDDESTKYRVTIVSQTADISKKHSQELNVSKEHVVVSGLESGTTYRVTVAGGNSDGYGRESEEKEFTTDLGVPRNVFLTPYEMSPSTSLQLTFDAADGNPVRYEALLYTNTLSINVAVKPPRYLFKDLKPNTKYSVGINGVFENGNGKRVESGHALTAPSAPDITCCLHNDEPSRKLIVKWKSDEGCNEHQIKIKLEINGAVEKLLVVKNQNESHYTCDHEATQYSVQVCSKNNSGHFSDWSKDGVVNLAPAQLENVVAKQADEGPNIIVQCDSPKKESSFYHAQAFHNQTPAGKQMNGRLKQGENLIEFRIDLPAAQTYKFFVWAENAVKTPGKKAVSNEVTSRPNKAVIKSSRRSDENPSTDIVTNWKSLERCDSYEVMIVADGKKESLSTYVGTTSYTHRCKLRGEQYAVTVRGICKTVKGEWSDEHCVRLAPGKVNLSEEIDEPDEPVNRVKVKWVPLKIKPRGYIVVLSQGTENITNKCESDEQSYTFKKGLKPGILCYCTIAAFNDAGTGEFTKSKYYRIAWNMPDYFLISPDDEHPSTQAKMSWNKPAGVNCFKLDIENNQTGEVISRELESTKEEMQNFMFQSGIPGNRYNVRLYSGCDSTYSLKCMEERMIMQPEVPTDIVASANRNVKGIMVEFKDPTIPQKSYEITVKPMGCPEDSITQITQQHKVVVKSLIPGESYMVSVVAVIEDNRSNDALMTGFVQTLPARVQNVTSRIENGSICFTWDRLQIEPDEYVIEWRVNNDPVTEDRTQATNFFVRFVKPAHCYSARVMACNASGCGLWSEWETFITDPLPPRDITVQKDSDSPETCLIARYQDEEDFQKRYRVTASSPDGAAKVVVTQEHYARLSGLQPGKAYIISVQTLFCGKESVARPYF